MIALWLVSVIAPSGPVRAEISGGHVHIDVSETIARVEVAVDFTGGEQAIVVEHDKHWRFYALNVRTDAQAQPAIVFVGPERATIRPPQRVELSFFVLDGLDASAALEEARAKLAAWPGAQRLAARATQHEGTAWLAKEMQPFARAYPIAQKERLAREDWEALIALAGEPDGTHQLASLRGALPADSCFPMPEVTSGPRDHASLLATQGVRSSEDTLAEACAAKRRRWWFAGAFALASCVMAAWLVRRRRTVAT